MEQNFYNPGFVGGSMYGQQQPVKPKAENTLTPEEQKLLKVDNSFTLNVTPTEMAQAMCAHRNNGEYTIVPNGDGTCTCTQCHATFSPDVVDYEYAKNAVDMAVNVMETAKLMGIDINTQVFRDYYQYEPFFKKLPQMFKLASNSFNRYNQQQPIQNLNQPSYFNAFNYLMNPTVPMSQPQYGYGYQQPGYGQPMMTPTMGMQAQTVPGANPFYQQPQPSMGMQQPQPPTPVTPAPPQYQPQAPTQTPAPSETVVKESIQL